MTWDWRNATLPMAYALQDFGSWLRRRGEAFEKWISPRPSILASAASTWADNKVARHILALHGDTSAALCGLEPGIFGWQNQNGIYHHDVSPQGYCAACLQGFQG